MLRKEFQINNETLIKGNFFLFYGANEGAKSEKILQLLYGMKIENIQSYDEKQILDAKENFYQTLLSKSLFEDSKTIKINRVTDKSLEIINEILDKNITDIKIIFNASILEKKSKIRSLFEKHKDLICVPFYEDSAEILFNLTKTFLNKNKISMSQFDINLLTSRCNGDRNNLYNELNKIKFYSYGKKKIDTEVILKLTNLAENYSISELVDNCLAKNSNKTLKILNENNFSSNDCILVSRTFLQKSKKLFKLSLDYEKNNNLELTIKNFKPPIFWKDKEITKQQINSWKPTNIKRLIYQINELELNLKKNIDNAINIIYDFILEKTFSKD